MKIKIREYTRINNLLSHCILKSITKSANGQDVQDSIMSSKEWIDAGKKEDAEIDVNFTINGIELDIRYFFEWLDSNYKTVQYTLSKEMAEEMFEKWKKTYMSKNSKSAKLQKVKEQLEKATNQLKMVEQALQTLNID